jgi:hypothetical protein
VLLEIRCRSATGQSDVFWRRFAETLESELSLVERTDFLGEFGFYTLRRFSQLECTPCIDMLESIPLANLVRLLQFLYGFNWTRRRRARTCND